MSVSALCAATEAVAAHFHLRTAEIARSPTAPNGIHPRSGIIRAMRDAGVPVHAIRHAVRDYWLLSPKQASRTVNQWLHQNPRAARGISAEARRVALEAIRSHDPSGEVAPLSPTYETTTEEWGRVLFATHDRYVHYLSDDMAERASVQLVRMWLEPLGFADQADVCKWLRERTLRRFMLPEYTEARRHAVAFAETRLVGLVNLRLARRIDWPCAVGVVSEPL